MEYLLFVAYLIFFAWLTTRTKFFLASGLTRPQLVILFLLKVIAGIIYGWIGIYYGQLAQMSDTWSYHSQGLIEFRLLHDNPHEYFTNLFHNQYERGMGEFFGSQNSYWNDLKSNVFIKLLSIFDIFSGGYYYVNVIFYTYLVFVGPIALYRVMSHLFPDRRLWVMAGVFFVPSFFYWGSGLHKEGLISMGISMIMFAVYFSNQQKKFSRQHLIFLLCGVLLMLILRNFVLLLMLPAVAAWLVSMRRPAKSALIFSSVYAVCIAFFFTARFVIPQLDFPAAVVAKRQAFHQLTAQSSILRNEIEPTFTSFLLNAPEAVALSATRPYPADISHLLLLAAAVEIDALLLLIAVYFIFRLPRPSIPRPALYFCFFFSVSLLLAIGLSVNNMGAIARYRSIIFPLVMTPVLAQTDWNRIGRLITGTRNATR